MGYIIWVLLPRKGHKSFSNTWNVNSVKVVSAQATNSEWCYSHLCKYVSHNFAIFIFCNVWELKRWKQTISARQKDRLSHYRFNFRLLKKSNKNLLCQSPEARTNRGRSSISSGSFLEDTAGYSAACSSGPPAKSKKFTVRNMHTTMLTPCSTIQLWSLA